ncbi:MAG: ribonuclease HII [Cyanobacteria bacterium J06627_15]
MGDCHRVAGVDEVGRGALFGPVVAAAVMLTPEQATQLAAAGVTDSKRLRPRQRTALARQIQTVAIDCRVAYASVREIDRLNILQASLLAMRRSIERLSPAPTRCLIDGNQLVPGLAIEQEAWVKGDTRSVAIAAASIAAKVWRDTLIIRLDARYPGYDLASNKGYGSQKHRDALQQLGPTLQHRRSFAPCRVQQLGLKV